MRCNGSNWALYSPGSWDGFRNDLWALWAGVIMRLEHHLVGGYVRYISPHIIIIIIIIIMYDLKIQNWSLILTWHAWLPIWELPATPAHCWHCVSWWCCACRAVWCRRASIASPSAAWRSRTSAPTGTPTSRPPCPPWGCWKLVGPWGEGRVDRGRASD